MTAGCSIKEACVVRHSPGVFLPEADNKSTSLYLTLSPFSPAMQVCLGHQPWDRRLKRGAMSVAMGEPKECAEDDCSQMVGRNGHMTILDNT